MSEKENATHQQLRMFLSFLPLILFVPLLSYGMPEATTALILLVCISWSFLWNFVWRKTKKISNLVKVTILLVPTFFWLDTCFVGWHTYSQDICRGRMRCELDDTLFFVRNGEHTELINQWLGKTAPHWTHSHYGSSLLSQVSDGDERVNTYSIIKQGYLPKILKLLPSDRVRKQVLKCVCDPQNQLRFYQGLLMVCVMEWGYPQQQTANEWWEKHQQFFIHEPDQYQAARIVQGWRYKVEKIARKKTDPSSERATKVEMQLYAIESLERGSWTRERSLVREVQADIYDGFVKPYPVEPQWWE